eukprot:IDg13363t1
MSRHSLSVFGWYGCQVVACVNRTNERIQASRTLKLGCNFRTSTLFQSSRFTE